eukprot:TRINITY_DN114445_c0_g1_i1.p1 TRINITY_DN114445_c0_g1~~TRINITY_DN114445_c0_g1_i1.p1  ORF type:complete len:352 (-),score=-4.24 TRINITY_DN114445_c0_g1_i1:83-1138(-)
MQGKQRPPNAPGSNGLRGGKNCYSLKTANGNWIEDVGGSSVYKRGFTTDAFQTECQHQQLGYNMKKVSEFGADLPIKYIDPRTTIDTFNPRSGPLDNTWETNTQTMMKSSGLNNMNLTSTTPKVNMTNTELDNYRKSWTNDTPLACSMRFETESRRAGNTGAPKKFAIKTMRFLPGTPIGIERFRNRLIETYGILGITILRGVIGNIEELSSMDFKNIIKKLNINMTRVEIEQMIAYLTPTDSFATTRLFNVVKGNMEGNDANKLAEEKYNALIYNTDDPSSNNSLTINQLLFFINSTKYPEIATGIEQSIQSYCINDEINKDGFILLCNDMYNSSPDAFCDLMTDLWGNI